jgi:tRNA A-37 threonylcarbamoyl transferase component Bud32
VPLTQPARMALIERIAEDLSQFHGAGHWHGAGQLRNMTLLNGRLYRIDFEEDLEGVLPLPYRQALDVFLAAFSLAHHRNLEGEDQKEALIRRLVESWKQSLKADPAVHAFDRMTQALRLPSALAERLSAINGRDVVAFRVLARSLLGSVTPKAMPAPL